MTDEKHMRRALALARRGLGRVEPNPPVGALVVKGKAVVAEGGHPRFGGPHAEALALEKAGRRARGATLYVTLEPCAHHGKTPPCTQAVLRAGVRRVVIGAMDPVPGHSGGARKLARAGVEVHSGVLEDECRRLIEPFRKLEADGLPFVTLKWAMSLDGRIATRAGDSKWVTSPEARARAHRLRALSQAVLVGIGTVLSDDPELTVRHARGPSPARVVLDSRLRLPAGARLLKTLDRARLVVFHGPRAPVSRRVALARLGVEVHEIPRTSAGLSWKRVLRVLGEKRFTHVLVEGGGKVLTSALESSVADRAAAFVAPIIIGGSGAPSPVEGRGAARISSAWRLANPRVTRVGPDMLMEGDLVRGKGRR